MTNWAPIAPYAQSLFERNIDMVIRLITDTTWQILRVYAGSVPLIRVKNVGIGATISLGPVEDVSLHDKVERTFFDVYPISLNCYPVLSGKGSALWSICDKDNVQQ
jgi:hypothetical protein